MKKLIVFGVLAIMGFLTTLGNYDCQNVYDAFPSATVSFYVDEGMNKVPSYVNKVHNGNGEILTCNALIAKSVENNLSYINGKSISFEGTLADFNKTKKLLNVKEVTSEKVQDIFITYGYVAGENRHVFVDGKKVNVQLAYNDGKITVGFPLILGSY